MYKFLWRLSRMGFFLAGSSRRTPMRNLDRNSRILEPGTRVYNRPHTTCYSVRVYMRVRMCACVGYTCACRMLSVGAQHERIVMSHTTFVSCGYTLFGSFFRLNSADGGRRVIHEVRAHTECVIRKNCERKRHGRGTARPFVKQIHPQSYLAVLSRIKMWQIRRCAESGGASDSFESG